MIKIHETPRKIQVSSPAYTWEWDAETDIFLLFDSHSRLISRARHRPLIIGGETSFDSNPSYQIKDDRISIIYEATKSASRLTVSWSFKLDFISLEQLQYESSESQNIVQVVYFPEADGNT